MSPQQAFNKIQQLTSYLSPLTSAKKKWEKRIYKKYKKHGKVRVPEYENYLMENSYYAYYYSKEILKGKLPEKMHNRMLGWAFLNEPYAKLYFEYIKQK